MKRRKVGEKRIKRKTNSDKEWLRKRRGRNKKDNKLSKEVKSISFS